VAKRRARRIPAWLIAAALVPAALAANWVVQVARKPSELAGVLLPTTGKSPAATWSAYGDLFEAHATPLMTPELLAALAQAESSGDPAARTYWRWRWTLDPLRVFAPASSAVGLFQITDGTFERCRRLCVRGGEVRRDGPWSDWRSCWFNGLYNRLVPSHAVEMTAACLDDQVARLVAARRGKPAPERLKKDLAVVSHLCGPASPVVDKLLRTGLVPKGARCGDHDARLYLAGVRTLESSFARLRRARR
jgi:hypothetical protein